MLTIAWKKLLKFTFRPQLFIALPHFALISLATAFFALRMLHGWTFDQFQDEGQDLVAALAIHAGEKLYSGFIYQHGPAVVILTQLYGMLTGWGDITYARIIPSLLAALAALSIATSSGLPNPSDRLIGAAIFLGILSSVWLTQYLYIDSYHTIGGTAIVIGVALLVTPAWRNSYISFLRAAGAGATFILAAAAAYTFAPSGVLLSISAILALPADARRFRSILGLAFGAGTMLMLFVIWLGIFGSFSGYFAFHIVLNQIFYTPYMHLSWSKCLYSFIPSSNPDERPHAIGLVCLYTGFLSMAVQTYLSNELRRLWVSLVLGFIGILLLDGRCSTGFPDGCFLIACIGVAALTLPIWRITLGLDKYIVAGWIIVGIAGLSIASAEYAARYSTFSRQQIITAIPYHYGRDNQALSVEIRRILAPNERLLALVYDPILYLSADRLPVRKYVAYFPWEADYARHPWFGRDFDFCADLPRHLPKLIFFDNWTVWDKYKPAGYMPCLAPILASRYRTDPGFPLLHIRTP